MKNIQYLLFDLDGTIIDSKEGITGAARHTLTYCGVAEEEIRDLCRFIGPPLRDSFEEFFGFSKSQIDTAVQVYRKYYTEKGVFQNALYPGVEDVIRQLKDGGKTIILSTSKPQPFAEKILAMFHLTKYFDHICGGDLQEKHSSKAEIIRNVFEAAKISDPRDAVMIGDRKYDILGAKQAGIRSVGVLYGYGGREELALAGADKLIEDITELLPLFLPEE